MKPANRVIFNSGILYLKIIISVGISLFSTRIVLDALGSIDYGIFNLVAGIIIMLSFLNNAMATSTQRYLSYYQGQKDLEMQKKVFTNSFVFHISLGIIIVLLLEMTGLFLFDGFLNIPVDRIQEAKTIYHFMSATVFFTIVAVPFNGSLVAHENMLWISIVNIIEVLLKLGIALFLYVTTWDRLITFGVLTAGISIISFFLYAIYVLRNYKECTFVFKGLIDKKLIRELGTFAGWNLFGSLCSVGRTQGLAVILNLFFGVFINAAYAIANQVGGQLLFLSSTMLKSINPQIMKSEGRGDRERMLRLSMIASKFGFFLLSAVAIPFIFEMDAILNLWLKDVPEYSIIFCQMVLIGAMVNQLTIGLQSAIQATGEIKLYQVTVGGILLLNLPIAYGLLTVGFPPYVVLISYIVIEFIACCLRLIFLHLIAKLSIHEFLQKVSMRQIFPVLTAVLSCILVGNYWQADFRLFVTICSSIFFYVLAIYFTGLCRDEKEVFENLFSKLSVKVLKLIN